MQNLEETLKDSFAEAEVEGGFLEVEGGDPEFNWSPKKERLLQGSPRMRGPGGDLRGWRSEKDVARGGEGEEKNHYCTFVARGEGEETLRC